MVELNIELFDTKDCSYDTEFRLFFGKLIDVQVISIFAFDSDYSDEYVEQFINDILMYASRLKKLNTLNIYGGSSDYIFNLENITLLNRLYPRILLRDFKVDSETTEIIEDVTNVN